ncbi:MAG: energy-dependent translational throttle protein EttA [Pseudomonadota bacterium]|nr:energy-dependent translational throttle protein EttA [Pseudomonadota bacterium]MEC7831304.1 energy-dependent translational throttle protein EttA [Pseudomonadota bacterium]MEC9481658.1 energy-dependent translational throttle protein EttA [Pseudomonadota bacterium]
MSSNQYIFSLQDLSKSWPGGKTLFENINLSFLPNAKIGIVGINGSGKSTFLKILSGIDKEFNGEIVADKSIKIGYLPQEPELDSSKNVFENISIAVKDKIDLLNKYNELSMNYSEEIADDLSNLQEEIESKDLWDLDSKIEQAMQALRCPEKEKNVSLLSGGEKRRVAICKLLLEEPDLLLLDEPTNHLDPETVAWLENYLMTYKGTVILITHDIFFLDNITEWILELDRGKAIPYEGNYSKWLIQKKKRVELEVKHENARLRRLKNEVDWISSSPKARQTKSKARINNYEALLDSKNVQSIDDPQIIIPNAPRLGDLVLEINNLKKIIEDKILIEKLSFKMPKGAIVGVVGANGVGKTTLFNIISDNLEPSEGSVRLGETVNLGYVDQSRESLDSSKTVWEEISEGNDVVEINSTTINTRAYTSSFNFKGTDQQKKVGQLSGGERNRVHLAKVLKSGANVILLDEPTNDLDVETLHALEYAIEKFSGCVMIISHDRWFLDRICTHILAFEGNSHVEWFEGNYLDYAQDRKNRFGEENEIPSKIKYKKFSR